ncbi:MAG: hypothetical protein AB7K24_30265, partial [Gemmataceae bacterium]
SGGALVEMKFHLHVPALFHELLPQLPQRKGRVSKYRQCVQAVGVALLAGLADGQVSARASGKEASHA